MTCYLLLVTILISDVDKNISDGIQKTVTYESLTHENQ